MIKLIIFGGLALITLIVLIVIVGYKAILPFVPYFTILAAVLFLVLDSIQITTNNGSVVVVGLGLLGWLLPYDINVFIVLGIIVASLITAGIIWYKVQKIRISRITKRGFYPANIIVFIALGLAAAYIVRVAYFTEINLSDNHNHIIIPAVAGIATSLVLSFCKKLERIYWG